MADYVDTFEIDYDKWDIYKDSDTSYTYIHNPEITMGADMQYRIVITLQEDGSYKFDAQDYIEIYGSGGWSKWTTYTDKVKDTILIDAIERISNAN